MNESENTKRSQTDLQEMLFWNDRKISLLAANRDGDLFYAECPECHGVDLKSKRIIMCRDCGQHFIMYFEDGFLQFDVMNSGGSFHRDKEARIIRLEKNGNWYAPFPRHDIASMNPVEQKVLYRDLRNGKDAHGHAEYERITIIKK